MGVMAKGSTINRDRFARLAAVATIQSRVLTVVKNWAKLNNYPDITDVLAQIWASDDGNAEFYLPPDMTGASLLSQAMNIEFNDLNLKASDLDPNGKIVTVGDLVSAA
jgi:hypothetical protein